MRLGVEQIGKLLLDKSSRTAGERVKVERRGRRVFVGGCEEGGD
jgi:hypothetical protein